MREPLKTHAVRRVLVAELDSIAQRRAAESAESSAEFLHTMTGRIRSALMISGRLLVTDAMLLDGTFFIRLPPRRLATALGFAPHQLPITVLSPHPNLATALNHRLDNPEFEWQLQALSGTPRDWPNAEVESAWRQWIEAADHGWIQYEHNQVKDLGERPVLSAQPDPLFDAILNEPARDLLSVGLDSRTRSEFKERYSHAREAAHSSQRADLDTVWTWWNTAYLDELALQHHANWITFDSPEATGGRVERPESLSLEVSSKLLDQLTALTPAGFATAYDRATTARSALLDRPRQHRLRTLTYAATSVDQGSTRSQVLRGTALRIIAAIAVILAALPAFPDEILGLQYVWWAFVVLVIATVPYREISLLRDLLPTNRRAVVTLRRPA